MEPIDFKKKGEEIFEPFLAVEVSHVNGSALRMAVIEGEYKWHVHPNEDEFFLVIDGEISVEFKDKEIPLKEWQGLKVPKGTIHRTKSKKRAVILIIEPIETNTRGLIIAE